MSKSMFYIIFIFGFLSFGSLVSFAQDSTPKPNLEKAQFDEDKLKELASDRSFDYNRKYVPRNYSIRELISLWIADKISRFFRLMGRNSDVSRTVFYIISIVGVTYLVIKLLKLDRAFVFYGYDKKNKTPVIFAEDIHEMDMEKALKEAIEAKEYKKAVRIFYLTTLKVLDAQQLIKWEMHKTNHDYEAEITDTAVKTDFVSLTRYFEYIIYGSFSLDEEGFRKAKEIYKNVRTRIEQQVA